MHFYSSRLHRHGEAVRSLSGLDLSKLDADQKASYDAIVAKFKGDIIELNNNHFGQSAGSSQAHVAPYLAGPKLSAIDLLVYCELYSAKQILPSETISLTLCPNILSWYAKVKSLKVWPKINL